MIKKIVGIILTIITILALSACDDKTQSAVSTYRDDISELQMVLLCDIVYNDELDNYMSSRQELYCYDASFTTPISSKYIDKMPDRNLPAELSGYTVIDFDHGNITGFRAGAFKYGSSIILVYCGTEDWADYEADLGVALFDFSSQDGQAKQFATDIAKEYSDCDIYVVGYSMGGRLAYLGAEAIADTEYKNNLKKVCTFNGLGVKEAFDLADGNLSNIHGLEGKIGDFTVNHIVNGDDVSDDWMKKNFSLHHVGECKYYDCTNPYDMGYPKFFFDLGIDLNLTKHDLYTFIDVFSADKQIEPSYTESDDATSETVTEEPTVNTFDPTGTWSTNDGTTFKFASDGTYDLTWGFGISESGTYSVSPSTGNAYPVQLNGGNILQLMGLMYGGVDSSYHFELLVDDNNHMSLVQVYGDYSATTSPCKLSLTRQ